jgi:hypothetical protein
VRPPSPRFLNMFYIYKRTTSISTKQRGRHHQGSWTCSIFAKEQLLYLQNSEAAITKVLHMSTAYTSEHVLYLQENNFYICKRTTAISAREHLKENK